MRSDAARRRERILGQARALFAQFGSAVSLDQVAAASDVGIATLYRNFPTRAALIEAVILGTISDVVRESELALTRLGDSTLAESGHSALAGLEGSELAGLEGSELAELSDSAPAAAVWRDYVRSLVGLKLGALTQALGDDVAHLGAEIVTAQGKALDSVEALLGALAPAAAVRADVTASDVIVAIGIITRPQASVSTETTERVTEQLVEAYISWSAEISAASQG